MSSKLTDAKGPITPLIDSWPGDPAGQPLKGFRRAVGRKPYVPQKAAGARMEPPISDPIPKGAHLKPVDAPSPPDEPPGVSLLLYGFNVVPVM